MGHFIMFFYSGKGGWKRFQNILALCFSCWLDEMVKENFIYALYR